MCLLLLLFLFCRLFLDLFVGVFYGFSPFYVVFSFSLRLRLTLNLIDFTTKKLKVPAPWGVPLVSFSAFSKGPWSLAPVQSAHSSAAAFERQRWGSWEKVGW